MKGCLCCSEILIIELDFSLLDELVCFSKRGMVIKSYSRIFGVFHPQNLLYDVDLFVLFFSFFFWGGGVLGCALLAQCDLL